MRSTPVACIIKLFTGVINSVSYESSVFVRDNKKLLTIKETLAQYITVFIISVKYFMIQAPGANSMKLFCCLSCYKIGANVVKLQTGILNPTSL